MGIVNVTELAKVSASRRFGEPPVFQRQFVVEVDDPETTQSDILGSHQQVRDVVALLMLLQLVM